LRNVLSTGLVLVTLALATPAAAQETKLQVHGYLTQAYGAAHGGTFLGIPEGGTADYRTAALQLRYTMTPNDQFVWQFSHRRLGTSPITVGEPELKVDWLFYSRQMGNLDLRVGRLPIPAGIYNEVRDVGVLLPLYRAPYDFYLEGAFTSETVDGLSAGYHLFADAPWNVEVSLFGGRYDMTNSNTSYDSVGTPIAHTPEVVNVDNALGTQLWLNTPVDGVRAGFGASRLDVQSGDFEGKWTEWHGSLDARTHWATLQAEYRRFAIPDVNYTAGYVYAGFHATPQLTLHGQMEFSDVVLTTAPGAPKFDYDRTKTIGVSYAFRSDLVMKGEYHATNGHWSDAPVSPIGYPLGKVSYFLVSFSTSF
jgi:hypothetical protein